uniref:Peptidase S1 domain-containing protein n=1 Tax=Panagrolaimus sp. ES5 TaxID=591445 RepID=A0AC34FIZ5_9BILA
MGFSTVIFFGFTPRMFAKFFLMLVCIKIMALVNAGVYSRHEDSFKNSSLAVLNLKQESISRFIIQNVQLQTVPNFLKKTGENIVNNSHDLLQYSYKVTNNSINIRDRRAVTVFSQVDCYTWALNGYCNYKALKKLCPQFCSYSNLSPRSLYDAPVGDIGLTVFQIFPYVVQLTIHKKNGKIGLCGAAIIDEHWILTAAHCIDGIRLADLKILYDTSIRHRGTSAAVTKRSIHSDYKSKDIKIKKGHDIALLYTPHKFPHKNIIQIARNRANIGESSLLIGFGDFKNDGNNYEPKELRYLRTKAGATFSDNLSVFRIDHNGGHGNSGSALIWQIDGRNILGGVYVGAMPTNENGGEQSYVVDVSHKSIRPWILGKISKHDELK